MKKTLLTLMIAVMVAGGAMAQDAAPASRKMPRLDSGVGPVMETSMSVEKLPPAAQQFLGKYFPGVAVARAKNDFKDRRYEVKLADGAEVDFDYNGNWIEIDAPDGATLPSSTLSALMPESVVTETLSGDALVNGGALQYVEEVESFPEFYVVQVRTPEGKSKAALSRTDGTVKMLKSKPAQYGHGDRNAMKMHKGKKDGKKGRAVPARLDKNPRFY